MLQWQADRRYQGLARKSSILENGNPERDVIACSMLRNRSDTMACCIISSTGKSPAERIDPQVSPSYVASQCRVSSSEDLQADVMRRDSTSVWRLTIVRRVRLFSVSISYRGHNSCLIYAEEHLMMTVDIVHATERQNIACNIKTDNNIAGMILLARSSEQYYLLISRYRTLFTLNSRPRVRITVLSVTFRYVTTWGKHLTLSRQF